MAKTRVSKWVWNKALRGPGQGGETGASVEGDSQPAVVERPSAPEVEQLGGLIEARSNRGIVVGHGGRLEATGNIHLGQVKKITNVGVGSGGLLEKQLVPSPEGWSRLPGVRKLLDHLENQGLLVLAGSDPGRLADLAVRLASVAASQPDRRSDSLAHGLYDWLGSEFKGEDLARSLDALRENEGKGLVTMLFQDLDPRDLGRLLDCTESQIAKPGHLAVATMPQRHGLRERLKADEVERYWVDVDSLWDEIFPKRFLSALLTRELGQRGLKPIENPEEIVETIASPGRIEMFADDLARRKQPVDDEQLAELVLRAARPDRDLVRTYRNASAREQRLMICAVLVDGMVVDQALATVEVLMGPTASRIDLQDLGTAVMARLVRAVESVEGRIQLRQEIAVEKLFDLAWHDHRHWLLGALGASARLFHGRENSADSPHGSAAWEDIALHGTHDKFRRLGLLHTQLLGRVGVRSRDAVPAFLLALTQSAVRYTGGWRDDRLYLRVVTDALIEFLEPGEWVQLARDLVDSRQISWWLDRLGRSGGELDEAKKMREILALTLGQTAVGNGSDHLVTPVVQFLIDLLEDERLSGVQVYLLLPDLLEHRPESCFETVQTLARSSDWLVRYGVGRGLGLHFASLPKEYRTWWSEIVAMREKGEELAQTVALGCLERLRHETTRDQQNRIFADFRTLVHQNKMIRQDVVRAVGWLADDWYDGLDRVFAEIVRALGGADEQSEFVRRLASVHEEKLRAIRRRRKGRLFRDVAEGAGERTAIEQMIRGWLLQKEDRVLQEVAVEFYLAVVELPSERQEATDALVGHVLQAWSTAGAWIAKRSNKGGDKGRIRAFWNRLLRSATRVRVPLLVKVLIRFVSRDEGERTVLETAMGNLLRAQRRQSAAARGAAPEPAMEQMSPSKLAAQWLDAYKPKDHLIFRWQRDAETRALSLKLGKVLLLWKIRPLFYFGFPTGLMILFVLLVMLFFVAIGAALFS